MNSSQANRGTMWASSNQRWAFVFEPKPECQYSVSSGLVKSESTWLLDTPRLPGGTDYLFPPAASLKKITTGGLRMRNLEALKAKRKEMLANPTEAEAIFHERIKQLGERFHPQHIIGFYIVDFVFPKKMLIVEIDGKHHRKGEPYKHDMRRTEFLKSLGFEVSVSRTNLPELARSSGFAPCKASRMMHSARRLREQKVSPCASSRRSITRPSRRSRLFGLSKAEGGRNQATKAGRPSLPPSGWGYVRVYRDERSSETKT
jgi:very-short-patch-repair endonuclease